MLALLYGLIQGSTNGWTTEPIACLIAGVASLIAFAIRQRAATNPLILPTLLNNRGFTAGMLLGLFYFAVVAGMAYVVSVFLQTALHRSAGQAALGLSPMTVGIIVASFASRPTATHSGAQTRVHRPPPHAPRRRLDVDDRPRRRRLHQPMGPRAGSAVFGAGMGACMGSLYDIAVGNITPSEAGSASGSLSAVQQLANAIGAAAITTVYFTQIHHGGQAQQ